MPLSLSRWREKKKKEEAAKAEKEVMDSEEEEEMELKLELTGHEEGNDSEIGDSEEEEDEDVEDEDVEDEDVEDEDVEEEEVEGEEVHDGEEQEEEVEEEEEEEVEDDDEDGAEETDDEGEKEDEEFDGSFEPPVSQREANIFAMMSGDVAVRREPLLPGLLTVPPAEELLRKEFRMPIPGREPGVSNEMQRRLANRRRFVPWGGGTSTTFLSPKRKIEPLIMPKVEEEDYSNVEPLVLREANEENDVTKVEVDLMLCKWLRPHQREGTQFLFDCVSGARRNQVENMGDGCILADDMGLGKTLQGITLLWTMLQSKIIKRGVIVCPTSLVANWDAELEKFLQGRCRTLPLSETSRDEAIKSILNFLSPNTTYQVMIVSYETFRTHIKRFKHEGSCDLLICDEAHRLKNAETATSKALNSLQCTRRVLLSGTPMQNKLDEFYAMVSFCNPNLFGTQAEFRKKFERPILASREPDATESERERGRIVSDELSRLVNFFILRRTNALLSKHLPPKVVEIVCCKPTALQRELYETFLKSKAARAVLNTGKQTKVLAAITLLKKLCNHPKLIYDMLASQHSAENKAGAEGFEGTEHLFQPHIIEQGRGRAQFIDGWENLSGKMAVLARMLHVLRTETKDRIVIISNYGQTLDLMVQFCREKKYPFVRLDGATALSKRQAMVNKFNDPLQDQFVFLLSSKAGGCGLNLIGGNRLILFDPDWNPANDKQAAARVWRDGQTKRVFEYRFLCSGTMEEKIYQRQLAKEGLQSVVADDAKGKKTKNDFSKEELRDLFIFHDMDSQTHFSLKCKRCKEDGIGCKQVGKPNGGELKRWAHHVGVTNVPDIVMSRVGAPDVSFIFSCRVDGKCLENDVEAEKENEVLREEDVDPAELQSDDDDDSGSECEVDEGIVENSDAGGDTSGEDGDGACEDSQCDNPAEEKRQPLNTMDSNVSKKRSSGGKHEPSPALKRRERMKVQKAIESDSDDDFM